MKTEEKRTRVRKGIGTHVGFHIAARRINTSKVACLHSCVSKIGTDFRAV